MKNTLIICFAVLFFSCSPADKNKTSHGADNYVQSEGTVNEADIAEVYYFHGTRRCATCKAVARVAKGYTRINYEEEIKKGLVKVMEIDFDKSGNEALVEEFQVTRSGLFVRTVINNHETIYNLTEMAFMNAELHPDKIREAIKMEIEKVL